MPDSLQALHSAHQAVISEVAGKPLPLGYGDFPGEVAAIEEGLGLLVLEACEILLVRGPDSVAFLNGLTTNNIKSLPLGMAQLNLICGQKGKILHDIIVLKIKEDQILVISEPGEMEGVASWLDHFHIREEMELGKVDLVRVDLLGPEGGAALEHLGLSAGKLTGKFSGASALTPLLATGNMPRVISLIPVSVAPEWVEALLKTSDKAKLVGIEAYDEVRIRAGIPRAGIDFGQEHMPGEAALYDHISFSKGCYVGQEIHARMHYRGHPNRKLTGVTLPSDTELTPGAELFLEDKAVGTLTSLTRQPQAGDLKGGELKGIAMVRYQILSESLPGLAASPGGPHNVTLHPLASDLGAGRK